MTLVFQSTRRGGRASPAAPEDGAAPGGRPAGPPPPAGPAGRALLIGLALAPLLLWLVASPGLFNIDEALYVMSADAMARHGSFLVRNGFETYGAEALRLWFLAEGPSGLAPQYPPGPALLGAWPYLLLGTKGMSLLNALAASATVFATRSLAWRMSGDARVALAAPAIFTLASFWLEFSVGIWPHAVAVALTTAAFALALGAAERPGPAPDRASDLRAADLRAAAAGLAIGAACLFRLDAILALPPVGAVALLYAPQPLRMIAAGAAGLAAPLGFLAWVNLGKFGIANPFTYGQSAGTTSLGEHLPLLAAALGGAGLLLALRRLDRRRGWALGGAATLAALLAVAVEPRLQAAAMRAAAGAFALFLDARALLGIHGDLRPGPGGTMLNLGLAKKALGQSLPWLGLLVLLPFLRWEGPSRRGIALALLAAATVSAPFLPKAWYGGFGGNMRYFLTLVPCLATLCAMALVRLAEGRAPGGARRALLLGGAVGIAAPLGWIAVGPGGFAGAQQILTLRLLAAVALAALVAGAARLRPGRGGRADLFALALGGAGLAAGAAMGAQDLFASQIRRGLAAATAQALQQIPSPNLVYGPPELLAAQIGRDDALIAVIGLYDKAVDVELVRRSLADGRATWLPRPLFDMLRETAPDLQERRAIETPGGEWVEVAAAG